MELSFKLSIAPKYALFFLIPQVHYISAWWGQAIDIYWLCFGLCIQLDKPRRSTKRSER